MYLVSSYMPLEDNQFVHTSVPVRLFLAGCLVGVCVLRGREMSKSGWWEMIGLAAIEGVGALMLGFHLGRFDGKVRDAEKWL